MNYDADNSSGGSTVPDAVVETTEYELVDNGSNYEAADDDRRLPEFYYAHRPLVFIVFKCCDYYGYYGQVTYIVYWPWLAKQNKINFFIGNKLNHVKRWFSGVPP